jgi:NADPH:quinone reductase
MRALLVKALAADFAGCAVEEVATPTPGPGEVLVRVRGASVNFPDLLMTRGDYQLKPPLPFTPGIDFCGEVAGLGQGVETWRVGDLVVGGGLGAFAEYLIAPAATLRAKPAKLGLAEAAAYSAVYLTAYVALVRRARLEPGEWVLVHGAAGGVGLAAVDMAKALGGRVIACASTEEKLAAVQRLYAPDVIFDPVGGDVFDESLRCIAFDGRLLVVGFAAGRIPQVSVNIPLIKGFSVMGVRAGEYGRRFPERGRENLAAVDALIAEGRLKPHVHGEFSLDRWREAFDLLANRQVIGKAVVRPDLR